MPKKKNESFENKLARLEEIVEVLDNEGTGLEDMITLYEEGLKLTTELRVFLENAELKVKEISKKALAEDNEEAPF